MEQRIYMHFRAFRRMHYQEHGMYGGGSDTDFNWVWLALAKRYEMPVRKIKDIVKEKKDEHAGN
jgi:hypothetical protein